MLILRLNCSGVLLLLKGETMAEFINATPHAISIIAEDGELVTFPPSGILPRVDTTVTKLGTRGNAVHQFPVALRKQGEVVGLPKEEVGSDKVYIVSAMVMAALRGTRRDVVAPDTGPTAIRENGQIVAVLGFVIEA